MKKVTADKKSMASRIFGAVRSFLEDNKESFAALGRGFEAVMSRRTLGQTLSVMYGFDYEKHRFKKNYFSALSRLKNKGFIKFSDRDLFTLTDKGQGVLLKFEIDNVKLADFDEKKWDKTWRVLIFDIPEASKAVRNLFRNKIKELGFFALQKSVYVAPQSCEKEILRLAKMLKINRSVHILEAGKLGRREAEIKRFFGVFP